MKAGTDVTRGAAAPTTKTAEEVRDHALEILTELCSQGEKACAVATAGQFMIEQPNTERHLFAVIEEILGSAVAENALRDKIMELAALAGARHV